MFCFFCIFTFSQIDEKNKYDLEEPIEVHYNCYSQKVCRYFEEAIRYYQNQRVHFYKLQIPSIDEGFEIYYADNVTSSVKVRKYEDIKHCIDYFLAEEEPIHLKDFNLSSTNFLTVISPPDDFVSISSHTEQFSSELGFINVIVDDDHSKGFRVYNPTDKLIYSFDGTLFDLSRALKGKIAKYSFDEMLAKDSLSFIVMNTNPTNEIKETFKELKDIFPKIDFVIPDEETLLDIRALTNNKNSDFELFYAKLGLHNSLTMADLFPENLLLPSKIKKTNICVSNTEK